jgi:hypothetical protein
MIVNYDRKTFMVLTRSIVLNIELMFASLSLSLPAMTTTQSFSIEILEPTEASGQCYKTFYEQLLHQNPFAKKLQTQIVST